MTKLIISLFILLAFLVLSGCAGVSNLKSKTDKNITFEDIKLIDIGMSELVVVERLGRPISFGIDNDGSEYLHYENAYVVGNSVGIPSFIVGGNSASTIIKGFGVNIYIKDGKVNKKGYILYQEL